MPLNLNKKYALLIPSLNPKEELIKYIDELILNEFKTIIVVDDGSDEKFRNIFNEIEKRKECHLITHKKNKGKGKAIKDGLEYFLNMKNYTEYLGIITVDSDGQHLIKDVISLEQKAKNYDDALILGSRDFEDENVPEKSALGNKITTKVFKTFYGAKIKDTQTGLRCIPIKLIKDFIVISGNRYEYETNMLVFCLTNNINIVEVPITTVYINNNSSTHFRPVIDSILIYWKIFDSFLKFSMASIISAFIDIILFKLFLIIQINVSNKIMFATIFARIISSITNYTLSKKVAFKNKNNILKTITKYYILAIIQMLMSGLIVTLICKLTNISEVLIKIIIDTCLFLISYKIQRKWVFKNKK